MAAYNDNCTETLKNPEVNNHEQMAVWSRHASQWNRVGPPLKPSQDDTALTLSALTEVFKATQGTCCIAILGVTPELVQLPWPQSAKLDAFDHSADMIARVWQAHRSINSQVHEADWRALPLDDGTLHAAVGDASLNVLPMLKMYPEVLKEVHRVLAANGRMVVRCFIRPDKAEAVNEIVDAVMAGQVGSFHALKWRLAMALADESSASVSVTAIHQVFEDKFPSRPTLSKCTGWPQKQIDTIDAYRGSLTRYTFPTLFQVREHCEPWFDVVDVAYGNYELADRCPTMTMVRKAAGGDVE